MCTDTDGNVTEILTAAGSTDAKKIKIMIVRRNVRSVGGSAQATIH